MLFNCNPCISLAFKSIHLKYVSFHVFSAKQYVLKTAVLSETFPRYFAVLECPLPGNASWPAIQK